MSIYTRLAFDPREASQAYVVLDADDPTRPAELCVLELSGSW